MDTPKQLVNSENWSFKKVLPNIIIIIIIIILFFLKIDILNV